VPPVNVDILNCRAVKIKKKVDGAGTPLASAELRLYNDNPTIGGSPHPRGHRDDVHVHNRRRTTTPASVS
jgi:hypothetical protein